MNHSSNEIVVFTAVFGDNVKLVPQSKFKNVDFICITESPKNVRGWEVKVVPKIFETDDIRNNRYYKLQPHILFSKYKRSIYIDANFIVSSLPEDFFEQLLGDAKMLVFNHANTISDPVDCVYKEYDTIIRLQKNGMLKDDPNIMKAQMDWYRSQNYPTNNGLLCGGILIRNHNDLVVIKTMELWWQIVRERSKRDQLSFNFSAWRTNLKFKYIDLDIRKGNPWFYFVGKGKESMAYSLIKYRLRKFYKNILAIFFGSK